MKLCFFLLNGRGFRNCRNLSASELLGLNSKFSIVTLFEKGETEARKGYDVGRSAHLERWELLRPGTLVLFPHVKSPVGFRRYWKNI